MKTFLTFLLIFTFVIPQAFSEDNETKVVALQASNRNLLKIIRKQDMIIIKLKHQWCVG